jgi:hypothetical protein
MVDRRQWRDLYSLVGGIDGKPSRYIIRGEQGLRMVIGGGLPLM